MIQYDIRDLVWSKNCRLLGDDYYLGDGKFKLGMDIFQGANPSLIMYPVRDTLTIIQTWASV